VGGLAIGIAEPPGQAQVEGRAILAQLKNGRLVAVNDLDGRVHDGVQNLFQIQRRRKGGRRGRQHGQLAGPLLHLAPELGGAQGHGRLVAQGCQESAVGLIVAKPGALGAKGSPADEAVTQVHGDDEHHTRALYLAPDLLLRRRHLTQEPGDVHQAVFARQIGRDGVQGLETRAGAPEGLVCQIAADQHRVEGSLLLSEDDGHVTWAQ